MSGYVIAVRDPIEHPLWEGFDVDDLRQVCDLPVGHHHVTVNEDGSYTAVPMRRAGEAQIGTAFYLPSQRDRHPLWVDAPVEQA